MADRRYQLAYVLSIWFGCGRVPVAPGTAGTLGALPLYWLLAPLGPWAVAATAVLLTAVGIWSSTVVAERMGGKDPQIICIDEVAGVLVALVAAPPGWKGMWAGFVLFRIFDQWKPWPARAAERLPGGWGIVMDDVAAGLWAAALLLFARTQGWL